MTHVTRSAGPGKVLLIRTLRRPASREPNRGSRPTPSGARNCDQMCSSNGMVAPTIMSSSRAKDLSRLHEVRQRILRNISLQGAATRASQQQSRCRDQSHAASGLITLQRSHLTHDDAYTHCHTPQQRCSTPITSKADSHAKSSSNWHASSAVRTHPVYTGYGSEKT